MTAADEIDISRIQCICESLRITVADYNRCIRMLCLIDLLYMCSELAEIIVDLIFRHLGT